MNSKTKRGRRALRALGYAMIANAAAMCALALLRNTHPAAAASLYATYALVALMVAITWRMDSGRAQSAQGSATQVGILACVVTAAGCIATIMGDEFEDLTGYIIWVGAITGGCGIFITKIASLLEQEAAEQTHKP